MRFSEAAECAANNFISMLKNGEFIEDTLPNSSEDYTSYYENADYESYQNFIKTFTYEEYIIKREVKYYGQ